MGGEIQISKKFWELELGAEFLDTTPNTWSVKETK